MAPRHGHSLREDLERIAWLTERRAFMRSLMGAGLIPWVGCGTSSKSTADQLTDPNNTGGVSTSQCSAIPSETAGPYPGDGSNGPNALTMSGIVRSDIRSSFNGVSGTAAGIPLSVKIKLVSTSGGCTAPVSRAVYLWHCDRDGKYSLYSIASQNYLRGVQETDASGTVTFQSIFPACYSGRWPHIHFEIFPSLSTANSAGNKTNVSQLALPKATCDLVYATSGYSASVQNLSQVSLDSDNVFRDGAALQTPTMSGDVTSGLTAQLTVGV